MSFIELYAARIQFAQATPGSREWWEAVRRMRAAQRNIIQAAQQIVNCARSFIQSVYESFRPVIEFIGELAYDE